MPGYEDSTRLLLLRWTRMEGPFRSPSQHQVPCESGVQGHDQADIWLGGAGWLFQARVPTG